MLQISYQGLLLLGLSCFGLSCQHTSNVSQSATKAKASKNENVEEEYSAEYYFLAGQADLLKERYVQAQKNFEKAYQLDPNEKTAQALLENTLRFLDLENSLKVAEKMVLLYPKNTEIRLAFAELLAKNSQLDEALIQARKAQNSDLSHKKALALVGFILEKQEKTEEALLEYEKAFKKDSNNMLALSLTLRALIKLNRITPALEYTKAQVAEGNNDSEIMLLHASFLSLKGEKKEATKTFELLFEKYSKHEDYNDRLATWISYFDSIDKVARFYDSLLEKNANVSSAMKIQEIYILWELKKVHQALDLAQILLKSDPKSSQLLYLVGLCYEKLRDHKEALEAFGRIVPDSRYYATARMRMIGILREANDLKGALKVADTEAKDKFYSWQFIPILAQLHFEDKAAEKAIQVLEEGFEKYPDRLDLLFYKGVYEEKSGQAQDCIQTMKKVIAFDPDYANALNYLAYLYAQRNSNLAEAKDLVERALVLKPFDGYFLDTLGYIYFKEGDLDKAVELYKQAIQFVPNEGVVWEHIGDVLRAKSKHKEAKEIYETALTMKLEDDVRKGILEKIAEIVKELGDGKSEE